MRKHRLLLLLLMLTALLIGCGAPGEAPAALQTEPSTEAPPEPATEETAPEPPDFPAAEVFDDQIQRYFTALSGQWDEGQYFENEMSPLPVYYYEGTPLENVGYSFLDLDGDGREELIIGAIQNAALDPAVFEIWTSIDAEPVLLAQGSPRNRYCLQYHSDQDLWTVANEASGGAASSAVHYLMLSHGQFVVTQGVILDAIAAPDNPWFLAYDRDWDVSNDTPIDEAAANAILAEGRALYTAAPYTPYSQYE